MRLTHALLFSSLIALAGCGSSSTTTPAPTFTSGSVYETNAPITVSTIAGTAGSTGSTDGTSALFGQPNGVAVSGNTLFVADFGNSTIRAMDLTSKAVTTLAGTAGATGTAGGIGALARFNGPHFLTVDGTGTNLYVSDYNNNSIRKVVIASGLVTTLAGSAAGTAGAADGAGAAASFNGPSGIAITPDGTTLYVADSQNSSIRKIVIASGAVTTLATSATLGNPSGMVIDSTGTNLYLADYSANLIDKIAIPTGAVTIGAVTTLAGSAAHFGTADGTGAAASFFTPTGITMIGSNLYVTDFADDIVRKVTLGGVVTTVAGSAGTAGSTDGAGSAARFANPVGISTDGTNLFVADAVNRTLRMIK